MIVIIITSKKLYYYYYYYFKKKRKKGRIVAGWHYTSNKNKSTFSIGNILAMTRSMDARFDQINGKINKTYEELHVKIKQTNDDLTSKWTQFTSRIENSFLILHVSTRRKKGSD